MGTSGAYGGSGKAPWRKARALVSQTFGSSESGGSAPPSNAPSPKYDLGPLLQAIADGLRADDSELRRVGPQPRIPLSDIIATGITLAGLPFVGRAPRSSRQDRPVILGARRAGAALGGGFAVRAGNTDALRELGLELAELKALSPREQTERIISRVFGASSDETDQAFREAATVILLELLQGADGEIDYQSVIRNAAAEIIYRRALIEICAQVNEGAISPEEVKDRERQIRDYIRDLIQAHPLMHPIDGVPSPSECSQVMAEITAAAIDVLRAAQAGTQEQAQEDKPA